MVIKIPWRSRHLGAIFIKSHLSTIVRRNVDTIYMCMQSINIQNIMVQKNLNVGINL